MEEKQTPASTSPGNARTQGRKPSFNRATTFSILHQNSAERVVAAPWKLLRTLTSLVSSSPSIDSRLGQSGGAHATHAGVSPGSYPRIQKRSIVDELQPRGMLPIPEMPEMQISQREISQRDSDSSEREVEKEPSCRAVSISPRGSEEGSEGEAMPEAARVEKVASCRLSAASRQLALSLTVTVTDDTVPSPAPASTAAPSGGPRPGDPIRAVLAGLGEGEGGLSAEAFCTALRASAARLRDPKYSLHEFHDDMQRCFPGAPGCTLTLKP